MATNEELRVAEREVVELSGRLEVVQNELTELRRGEDTSVAELSAAMRALKAIEILTRDEDDVCKAVHELATRWREFVEK